MPRLVYPRDVDSVCPSTLLILSHPHHYPFCPKKLLTMYIPWVDADYLVVPKLGFHSVPLNQANAD